MLRELLVILVSIALISAVTILAAIKVARDRVRHDVHRAGWCSFLARCSSGSLPSGLGTRIFITLFGLAFTGIFAAVDPAATTQNPNLAHGAAGSVAHRHPTAGDLYFLHG